MTSSRPVDEVKFIADHNVGKLAKLLRMFGYDTLFFTAKDDNEMVRIAFKESRVILTRDTQIMKRRLVCDGDLKALFIAENNSKEQLLQVLRALHLNRFKPFSLCLECNQPLIPRSREEVKSLVPIRVLNNYNHYMECPSCHRIYWQGTHWQAMAEKLEDFKRRVVMAEFES